MERTGLTPGSQIGGYTIVAPLGSGGMGTVYRAVDGGGDAVALKLLHPHVASDDVVRTRLMREVAALQRLRHPAVAAVLDAEADSTEAFLVTELVAGRTLTDRVRQDGPLDADDLLALAEGLRSALAAVHAAGVVHRDLKPSNVLLTDDGPVLIDFGLAQGVDDDANLTTAGFVLGTPGYLAPELLDGGEPGPATDLWGWAVLLAFAATGRDPFGTRPVEAVLARARSGDVDLDGVGPLTRAAIAGALRPAPADRSTPDDVVAALRTVAEQGEQPPGAVPTVALSTGAGGTGADGGAGAGVVAAGAVAVAAVGAAGAAATAADETDDAEDGAGGGGAAEDGDDADGAAVPATDEADDPAQDEAGDDPAGDGAAGEEDDEAAAETDDVADEDLADEADEADDDLAGDDLAGDDLADDDPADDDLADDDLADDDLADGDPADDGTDAAQDAETESDAADVDAVAAAPVVPADADRADAGGVDAVEADDTGDDDADGDDLDDTDPDGDDLDDTDPDGDDLDDTDPDDDLDDLDDTDPEDTDPDDDLDDTDPPDTDPDDTDVDDTDPDGRDQDELPTELVEQRARTQDELGTVAVATSTGAAAAAAPAAATPGGAVVAPSEPPVRDGHTVAVPLNPAGSPTPAAADELHPDDPHHDDPDDDRDHDGGDAAGAVSRWRDDEHPAGDDTGHDHDDVGWLEGDEESDELDEGPWYERPPARRRWGSLLALALVVVLAGMLYPVVTVAVVLVLVVAVRTVGATVEAMHDRRERRGVRRADRALAVVSTPWYLLRSVLGVLPSVLVGGAVVLIVSGLGWWLLGSGRWAIGGSPAGQEPQGQTAGLLVGGLVALAVAFLWWGPLSRMTRTGARRTLAAVAPGPVGALVLVVVALVAAVLLADRLLDLAPLTWWPAPTPTLPRP